MNTWTEAEADATRRLIKLACLEDYGEAGDITSQSIIPIGTVGQAVFVARQPGIVAGLHVAAMVCVADEFKSLIHDGDTVAAGTLIATLSGHMRSILAVERTALNFLQRLSGIATQTRRYVEAVAGKSQVYDTRKTIPGWRILEKYAVRMGGGHNHRIGLHDGVLIKDNHLAALGGGPAAVQAAIAAARAHVHKLPVEIEVDSEEMFEAALACRPEIIMLDNMPPERMRQCVERRDAIARGVKLEASGGVNLNTIGAIADTGVDRISVGALTHSAPALDIALDYRT